MCATVDNGLKEEEQNEAAEVTTKQPKKKRPPKKTVEQNLSNLNSAESERKCEVLSFLLNLPAF